MVEHDHVVGVSCCVIVPTLTRADRNDINVADKFIHIIRDKGLVHMFEN